jgi:hypothetical protein
LLFIANWSSSREVPILFTHNGYPKSHSLKDGGALKDSQSLGELRKSQVVMLVHKEVVSNLVDIEELLVVEAGLRLKHLHFLVLLLSWGLLSTKYSLISSHHCLCLKICE